MALLGATWIGFLSCMPGGQIPGLTPRVSASMPAVVLGEWNSVPGKCGIPFSEGRLVVQPHQLIFYANKAEILELVEETPRRLRLSLQFEAGGEEPSPPATRQYRYQLSRDLQQLQDISEGEPGLIRWRCPSGRR